jgi:ABC-2 type transport system ATP-binding protein
MNTLKIQHVKDCFDNGDQSLGIRRLIDCVMDTNDLLIQQSLLDLLDVYESSNAINQESLDTLIQKLNQYPYPVKTHSNLNLLEVKDLGKQYKSSQFKISPLSFTLKYGEVVGLVGENGNGKTSLLRLLCKDLEPDAGTIKYAAEKESKSLFDLRSRLIYIPQRVPRWYGSLMDNLHFTLSSNGITGKENAMRAELIIARLGLRPFKNHTWNSISSGYRTRFELAKSLLRKPELMLLDEPLSNLDIISQQTILQDLKYMSESSSHPFGLVLSSQQLYEVEKISDLVIFLRQGEAQYQYKNQDLQEGQELIFEMEIDESRETITKAFESIGMSQIQFNGGVYVMHFKAGSTENGIFTKISEQKLKVNYLRNITQSSRRFFIQ